MPGRSRMFSAGGRVMKTWNCFIGCSFDCPYCNARRLAQTRLKNNPRYLGGFVPHIVEAELERKFSPGDFVFIGYMGDISFAPMEIVNYLLDEVHSQPEVKFLVCTKNPARYRAWLDLPANLYLGATIETNRDLGLGKAPPPRERFEAMIGLRHPRKFISIEPVCDFDLFTMVSWMRRIKPDIIEVGADNYRNNLPEPPWSRVDNLLGQLRSFCPEVVEKDGLGRLRS